MNPDWIAPAVTERLCLTLLHSLWQIVLITMAAWMVDRMFRSRSAERSYVILTSALIISIAALPATWCLIDVNQITVTRVAPAAPIRSFDTEQAVHSESFESTTITTASTGLTDAPTESVHTARTVDDLAIALQPSHVRVVESRAPWREYTPWLTALYLTGVVFMLLRLGWAMLRSSRRWQGTERIETGPLAAALQTLSDRWSLNVTPILVQSKDAIVPQVVGLVKPVILLPAAAVNRLSVDELELILTHELAHIRRHDMWLHLLQRLTETVLFFNPAVWFLSHRISAVREDCCDDIACRTADGPQTHLRYANALLRVIELSALPSPELTALAATGRSPSELRRRIARLFDEPLSEPLRLSRASLIGCAIAMTTLAYGSRLWIAQASPVQQSQAVLQAVSDDEPAKPVNTQATPFRLLVVGPDGKAVPNASVELRATPKVTEQQIQRGSFEKNGPYGTFARTDNSGQLIISLPEDQQRMRISIKKAGFGPYWVGWSSAEHHDSIPKNFTANLDTGWYIGGIVVDTNGQPVEGVRVSPNVRFKKPPGDKKSLGTGTRLTTDKAGAWKFDMVPVSKSKVTVSFDHPDFQALRKPLTREAFELQPAEQPSARIELPTGMSISGTVTDAVGKPVAGAVVKTKFVNERREAVTDAAGRYRIRGCEPMMTRIVIAAKGYATDMQEHHVDVDMEPVDFKLNSGGHVRVRVVDEHGKGIRRARIFFKDWRGNSEYFEFDHIGQYTNDDGVWEWHDAPLDEFTADICRPDGMQLLSQRLIAGQKEYVFSPPQMLVVSGKVLDAETKNPVAKFRVVPGTRNEPQRGTDDWWSRDEGYEATAGQFQLARGRAAPTHMIKIEAEGYKVARSRDILSTEGAIDLDFELQPAENISVRLLTPDGKPAAGARVALGVKGSQIRVDRGLISDRQTYAKEMMTDADGVFVIPDQDDAFQIVVTHSEGFTKLKSSDSPLPKTVTLTPYARVEGVFHLGADVASNIRLSVSTHSINSYGPDGPSIFTQNHVHADKDGRFVFERVIPGDGWIGRELHFTGRQGDASATSSKRIPMNFTAGRTTTIQLGGDGRRVVGRLRPPGDYSGKVSWNLASIWVRVDLPQPEWPQPPAEIQNVPSKRARWWQDLRQTEEGKQIIALAVKQQEEQREQPQFLVSVDREDRFYVDDVTPGNYVLTAQFGGDAPGSLPAFQFVVPQLQDGDVGRDLELGDLQMESLAGGGD
jgi:beta-lactamase regulating signal transducer with metallopeptidase domain/uncharacterized GH25 family protein